MAGFKDVIGNELVVKNLALAIKNNKVAHCYIINGESGLGKMTLAKAFATVLQCENDEHRPCGQCTSCLQMKENDHPDVIYVKHDKPQTFGVDDIRIGLNRDIIIRPYKSEHKIYILDDAELLNAQAQNAMLKTIEEPPEYAVILLLTNNKESFLPTILSRSVVLDLKPVSNGQLKNYLTREFGISGAMLEQTLLFARGNIGQARDYLEKEEYQKMLSLTEAMLNHIYDASIGEVSDYVQELAVYKNSIKLCTSIMMVWFRDIACLKAGGNEKLLVFAGQTNRLKELAGSYSYLQIDTIWKAFSTFDQQQQVNVNFEIGLELLLLSMKKNK